MAEFASQRSYLQFAESVKTQARFVHGYAARDFLETVRQTSKQRLKPLPNDTVLYRAQRGCISSWEKMPFSGTEEEIEVETKKPLSPERMIPKAEFVGDGRVNTRGIPCLYLATTASAVISETRPWVGSYITVARFKTVRDCQLVDCSADTLPSWSRFWADLNLNEVEETEDSNEGEEPEPDAATKERDVWGDIGFAFSKPVTHDEPPLDYIPTQILAEVFRSAGYDGIVYKSLLDEKGENIALFDPSAATLMPRACCLYRARLASFECELVEEQHEGHRARPSCPESTISSRFEMPSHFARGL